MRERALRAVEEADLVVLVHAVDDAAPALKLERAADLVVRTKIDLSLDTKLLAGDVTVSAVTGENIPGLRVRLDQLAFGDRAARPALALNARHVAAVREARESLARVIASGVAAPEVMALELREALDALGRVVGAVTPDELLGRIFSRFCIGK
jgi:tRNA modification GTPase